MATQVLDRRSATWTLVALFAAGALQAVLGTYQFVNQAGPEAFIIQGRFMRAYGTFGQPNPYAGYLGYLFPVAASLTLSAFDRWRRGREPIHLALAAACGALTGALLMGIIMSWSRGAWLGVIAGSFVVIALRSRRSATLAVGALIVLTLFIAVFGTGWMPGIIAGRVNDLGSYIGGPDPARTEITDANFAVLERLAHWRAGQRMFEDHPWLGVGIGNYGTAYGDYALPHWYLPLGHAHNAFINFLAEVGVIGFAAFIFFWLGVAWLAGRAAASGDGYAAALGIGILGAWAYLSVHSLFDNLFVQHMQLQLALLLGILFALIGNAAGAANPRDSPRHLRRDFAHRGHFGWKHDRISAPHPAGLASEPAAGQPAGVRTPSQGVRPLPQVRHGRCDRHGGGPDGLECDAQGVRAALAGRQYHLVHHRGHQQLHLEPAVDIP